MKRGQIFNVNCKHDKPDNECSVGGVMYYRLMQRMFYSSQADYNCYRVIANFVPNFVGMATGVKNLAKIYTKRVIAHFVQNFVAMATGVGR